MNTNGNRNGSSPRRVRRSWKAVVTAFMVVAMTSLLSCNTLRGLGRDIERGGEEIQDATRD